MVSSGQFTPGGVEFLLRRVAGDAENEARVVLVKAAPPVGAIGGGWLDSVARVNARKFWLQQEGVVTVFGLDLNKGPVAVERLLANGL